jgi:paraquat-inducible protein A
MSTATVQPPVNENVTPALGQSLVCHECGLTVTLPPLISKQKAHCPRCSFHLTTYRDRADQWVCALALTALFFFIASLPFEFLAFSVNGQSHQIALLNSVEILFAEDFAALGIIQAIAILVLPGSILVAVLYLTLPLQFGQPWPKSAWVATWVFRLLPWAMAEIFLIGTLVSLIKISALADIDIGPSFYAYVLFTLSMTIMLMYLDQHQLSVALKINTQHHSKPLQRSQSIQSTWALLCTAMLLYIPANFLPIMVTTTLGQPQPSTIIGGVVVLWQMGSYPIAVVIFVASVLVPVAKLVILSWLNLSIQQAHTAHHHERMVLYRFTEFIGRWSMIDVFVVAILVSLIQLGNVMSIQPGYAALAFCGVVITTMFAAINFDTRLIWQQEVQAHE